MSNHSYCGRECFLNITVMAPLEFVGAVFEPLCIVWRLFAFYRTLCSIYFACVVEHRHLHHFRRLPACCPVEFRILCESPQPSIARCWAAW